MESTRTRTPARRRMSLRERSRVANRARWGPQRVVRLDELDPAVAHVIRLMLAAAENAERRASEP